VAKPDATGRFNVGQMAALLGSILSFARSYTAQSVAATCWYSAPFALHGWFGNAAGTLNVGGSLNLSVEDGGRVVREPGPACEVVRRGEVVEAM
jgi:hypothetical protein